MRTKLRDWAVWQARAGCYSQAALSSNDSKTLYNVEQMIHLLHLLGLRIHLTHHVEQMKIMQKISAYHPYLISHKCHVNRRRGVP